MVSQVWLVDETAGAGKIRDLNKWFTELSETGKHHGYYVNGKKRWLICKSEESAKIAKEVFGHKMNLTTEGKRHLGAVLWSEDYRDELCKEMVERWENELE